MSRQNSRAEIVWTTPTEAVSTMLLLPFTTKNPSLLLISEILTPRKYFVNMSARLSLPATLAILMRNIDVSDLHKPCPLGNSSTRAGVGEHSERHLPVDPYPQVSATCQETQALTGPFHRCVVVSFTAAQRDNFLRRAPGLHTDVPNHALAQPTQSESTMTLTSLPTPSTSNLIFCTTPCCPFRHLASFFIFRQLEHVDLAISRLSSLTANLTSGRSLAMKFAVATADVDVKRRSVINCRRETS